jgi:hypothetical protein
MLIPRYWARVSSQATAPDGRRIPFHTWRASRHSQAEAESLAAEAATRIASRIERGEGFPERYTYGDRPLREEVVREIAGESDDEPAIAITRNSYGALVLNAARVFFIDVDHPHGDGSGGGGAAPAAGGPSLMDSELGRAVADALPAPLRSIMEGFLGRGRPAPGTAPAPRPATPADSAVDRLRQWLSSRPEWSVRVYRTSAGLRYLVTHDLFSPTDPEVTRTMQALGADEQYVRLCRAQKSFRARLTPKPWRMEMENPPVRFPFAGTADESAMRDWERRYDAAARGRATCRFVETIGSGREHPAVAEVVRLHDELTGAASGLPLA